ncbi:MAG: M6 family metalloprotease domain-containing protein [Prevotellaceae bacterium]|jgi:M6 family metalloprotease-like protein|nr:M6 family metalloprotease domain-containing protein [Prevotellaceae bacterium]
MKKFYFLFLAAFFCLTVQRAAAVPAYPYPIEITQPDGTTLTVTLKGDEFASWAESEDGYTLLRNSTHAFEYAVKNAQGDLVPSGRIAKSPAQRTASDNAFLLQTPKKLGYSSTQAVAFRQLRQVRQQALENFVSQQAPAQNGSQPAPAVSGIVHAPVILVQFQGKPFTKTQTNFQNLCNQVNYSVGTATGSVHDYFLAASYSQLDFQVDVYGPYTLANTIDYYDSKSGASSSQVTSIVSEATTLAQADGCNFANYDANNDGKVDGIHLIYAGYDQSAGAPVGTAIWATAWSTSGSFCTRDGKTVPRFSMSSELRGTSGTTITPIGVIAHELSHVFGLPDLYDTDYEESGGESIHLGTWDIMASGSWNNSGDTPPYHSAWCRDKIGWVPAVTLADPAIITLPNPATTGAVYKVTTTTAGEYFLIENRQKQGIWENYIPASGMLVYHVDENIGTHISYGPGWRDINVNPAHRGLYIKQAGGGAGSASSTRTTDPYPQPSHDSFTDASVPNSKSWAGANTAKPITDITHNTGAKTVTFTFMGGPSSCPRPTAISAGSVTASGATISWVPIGSATSWYFQYSANPDFSSPTSYTVSTPSKAISGLNANTTYYIRVRSVCTGENSEWREGNFTTLCAVATLPVTQDFENYANVQGATAINNAVAADCWSFTANIGTDDDLKITDAAGISDSHGWVLSGTKSLIFSTYYTGSGAAPGDEQILISPQLPTVDKTLTFTYRSYGSNDPLIVGYGTTNMPSAATWLSPSYIAAVQTTVTDIFIPASAQYIFFKYAADYAYYVALDDIIIAAAPSCAQKPTGLTSGSETTGGATISWTAASPAPADGYEYYYSTINTAPANTAAIVSENVVTGTLKTLTGLNSSTTYYFWVRSLCSISGNEKSNWTSSGSFTTLCFPVGIYPYNEGFEDYTGTTYNTAGVLPNCWYGSPTGYNGNAPHITSSGYYWYPHNSTKALTMTSAIEGGNVYAVLPAFDKPINQLSISFWYRYEIATDGEMTIGYITGSQDNVSSYVPLFTPTKTTTISQTPEYIFADAGVDLSSATYIAIRYNHPSYFYSVGIDDINVNFIIAPTVTTQAATGITQTLAVLNKTVTVGTETITAQGFKYKKVSETDWVNSANGILSNLIPNTEYEFYAYAATATYPSTNGATLTFSTLPHVAPIVTTQAATDTTQTSALLHKTVTLGTETLVATAQGFSYRKVGEDWITSEDGVLSGLTPNTEYEFFAFFWGLTSNETNLWATGDTLTFSTLAHVPPTVVTQVATEETLTSAVLHKSVTAGTETITAQGFKYKKVSETDWINSIDGILSNLIPNTEYEFYAYANTATFPNNNGATLPFSTLAHTPPTVTTLPVADFDTTSAILLKNVTAGTETITVQGFKYKKVSETDWINSTDGVLSDLIPNTEYEFYAYATTATYPSTNGATLTFSTLAHTAPIVVTQAATGETQTSAVLHKTVTAGTETITAQGFKYKKVSETTWINSTDGVLNNLIPNTEYEFYAYANTATYPNNNGETLRFTTAVTGIDDILENSISIYPNPVTDELNIKTENSKINSVEIFDVSGRAVGAGRALPLHSGRKTINVSALPAGVYLIRINTDNGVKTERFIKK